MAKGTKVTTPSESPKKGPDLYDILGSWDEPPPAWKPLPGEVLVGTVRGYDVWNGKYGECPMVFVEDRAEGQLVTVYLSATVLYNEFKKIRPKVGETVGIRYLGKSGDEGYHRYKVIVDREFDVDRFFQVRPEMPVTNVPDAAASESDVPF
jgi:hypothetical protein